MAEGSLLLSWAKELLWKKVMPDDVLVTWKVMQPRLQLSSGNLQTCLPEHDVPGCALVGGYGWPHSFH